MKTEVKLPRLMVDSSDKDGHVETIMDYILSWCIRMADEEFKEVMIKKKPILYSYCRKIVNSLVGENLNDNVKYKEIEVWKQDSQIDLWVQLVVENNNKDEKHAILIENKYYTGIRNNQLERYRNSFDSYYEDKPEWVKHYKLITIMEKTDYYFSQYDSAKDYGFQVLSLYDLFGDIKCPLKLSESDIFNEFFIRWYENS